MKIFSYTKALFELHILHVFKDTKAVGLKEIVNDIMTGYSDEEKQSIMKRIIAWNTGKEWWPENREAENREVAKEVAKELFAIWELHLFIMRSLIYYEQTVVEFAHDRLEDLEKKLSDGIINEQQYIQKCNWIKLCKERDEKLYNVCPRSAISSINIIGEDQMDVVFTVVCFC